jgi:hypothetical protein
MWRRVALNLSCHLRPRAAGFGFACQTIFFHVFTRWFFHEFCCCRSQSDKEHLSLSEFRFALGLPAGWNFFHVFPRCFLWFFLFLSQSEKEHHCVSLSEILRVCLQHKILFRFLPNYYFMVSVACLSSSTMFWACGTLEQVLPWSSKVALSMIMNCL